ncbi:MAG: FMN-binding protein [Marinifilaceae bacterium]
MCEGCNVSCGNWSKKRKSFGFKWKNLLHLILVATLVGAWFYGRFNSLPDYGALLQGQMKKVSVMETKQDDYYQIVEDSGEESVVLLSEGKGYGGPFTMATWIGQDSLIRDVFVLENRETPSFFKKLKDRSFFYQFKRKAIGDKFSGGEDVDFISGATVSSRAFTKAIKIASYQAGKEKFNMSLEEVDDGYRMGWKEFIVLLLVVLSIGATYKPDKRVRMAIQMVSLVFLGFAYNAALSVSGFSSLMLGFFPSVKEHMAWWILMGGSLAAVVFLTRNIYCSYLCPFHGIETLLNKISGINLKLSAKVQKIAGQTSLYLLWGALVLIFLNSNPTHASYEPFAMIFSLEGVGMQWYILPATLVGAFFMKDFFCKFFCPVGQTFTLLIKWRQKLAKRFKGGQI